MDNCLERSDICLHTPPDMDRRIWHFTVAFVGSCRAGKTKLLQRFVDSQFSDIYSQTTEATFVSKSVTIGRHHVAFQCWDTPGSVRSGRLDSRIDQLHAIFIVFDASRDAVADLEYWHHLATTAAPVEPSATGGGPLLVMVANKTDLGCHEESMARARDLCRVSRSLVFTLSILSDEENLEVDAMMLEVGKALTERHARSAAAAAAAPDVAAAVAAATAPALTAAPNFGGDGAETPMTSLSPASLTQSPQTPMSVETQRPPAPAASTRDPAEGDASQFAASKAIKLETSPENCSDGGSQGDEKSCWTRAACCCICW